MQHNVFIALKYNNHPAHAGGAFLLPCIQPGAGLSFSPNVIQPHTSVYSVFCRVNAIIPPTPQNSAQGFTVAFPAIAPAQPPTIPDRHNKPLHRLRHAGGHTRARTRSIDTRYHRHAWTLHRSAQAAYYNNVYKRVQGCAPVVDPCQTVQHIADHASPAGSAPTVCGSLASTAPGAPAEGSASTPVQCHPGGVSILPTPGGEVQQQ